MRDVDMKGWDFEAVTFDGDVYCVGCLPDGVDVESEDVRPIFATDDWDFPPPCCDECGQEHDYMGIIHHDPEECSFYPCDSCSYIERCPQREGRD